MSVQLDDLSAGCVCKYMQYVSEDTAFLRTLFQCSGNALFLLFTPCVGLPEIGQEQMVLHWNVLPVSKLAKH